MSAFKIPSKFGRIWEHLGTLWRRIVQNGCNLILKDMRYYLDKRSVGKDGRCPLRLRMRKDGKSAMPLTGIRISPDGWDDNNQRAKDARLNQRLRDMLDNAEDYVLRIKGEGRYLTMTLDELVCEISKRVLSIDSRLNLKETLAFQMEQYRDRQTKRGTREVYDRTIKTLGEYDEDFSIRSIREIDYGYLSRFEAWCLGRGMKVNSVSILMRNIRTVFNEARREGVTNLYPFSTFKIKQEETRKRALTLDELRLLRDIPVNSDQQRYKDFFMLMVYLIGINTTDLFLARPSDLKNGRLEYRRDKTGKLYSVKVEPEAMEIIERYKGRDFLLDPMDEHGDFLSWRTQLNKRLKALGQITGRKGKILGKGPFSEISTYWSRHTWATLAYQVGISVDVIGQALGHSDRSHTVTFTYIKPDQGKVDAANRKVIDFINGNGPIPVGTEPKP